MGLFSSMPFAAPVEPIFNTGMLCDIPTGGYVRGLRGENVLIGGHGLTFSVTGGPNTFKTDQLLAAAFQIVDRIPSATMLLYDTENSFKYARFESRSQSLRNIAGLDFKNQGRLDNPKVLLVKKADITGDGFFEELKRIGKERIKDKSQYVSLPIPDGDGKPIKILKPLIVLIDTLTHFSVSSVDDNIVDKNAVGDSGANMLFMRDGAAKTQLIMQMPTVCSKYGIHIMMSAHIGSVIQMDKYTPAPISLNFGRAGTKHKGVPEKFMQLNEHLIETVYSKPLLTKEKTPLFPRLDSDREKGNDLFLIGGFNSRNKGGASGVYFPYVYSQSEGMKRGLSMFYYLMDVGNWFSITPNGNKASYEFDLMPGKKYGRTTVREACDDDQMLLRALEIAVDMYQMKVVWRKEGDPLYDITPAELRANLEAKGYNWDVLLNTRGYYVPIEDEQAEGENLAPFLSTMDLLEMAQGTYHPFWLEKDNVTVKKNYWKFKI